MRFQPDRDRARSFLRDANAVVALTGAGISAESGIPTFRDHEGLWENHAIEDVATPQGFRRNPERVWRFYNERRKAACAANPNPAHRALARLEQASRLLHPQKRGGAVTVLTQNIDGLHQRAGSTSVVELHGSLWDVRCSECGVVSRNHPLELPILPTCEECEALLRPHVVWFGEMLDPEVLDRAHTAVDSCDLFLVVGTSVLVQPAAGFPYLAAERGVPVIEINLDDTPMTRYATVSLRGKAGDILPDLVRR